MDEARQSDALSWLFDSTITYKLVPFRSLLALPPLAPLFSFPSPLYALILTLSVPPYDRP